MAPPRGMPLLVVTGNPENIPRNLLTGFPH